MHRVLKRFIETKMPGTPDAVMAQTGTGKKKKCSVLFEARPGFVNII
jgi:hypothetical protein